MKLADALEFAGPLVESAWAERQLRAGLPPGAAEWAVRGLKQAALEHLGRYDLAAMRGGLPRADLARAAGVTPKFVEDVEAGRCTAGRLSLEGCACYAALLVAAAEGVVPWRTR